jgi:hypothetical protein
MRRYNNSFNKGVKENIKNYFEKNLNWYASFIISKICQFNNIKKKWVVILSMWHKYDPKILIDSINLINSKKHRCIKIKRY